VLHYAADTGPLLPTRTPSVVTVHGVASRWIDTARTPRQELLWRTRVRRAITSTRHVITVSESSATDVRDVFGVPEDRLTVIPHGIDVERFATPAELSPELAARVPERFALYLGNIEPRKNLVALVGAFSSPRLRARELPLVVVGRRAWNEAATMAAIAASDNVTHLDFVSDSDRAALMQRCTLFVFPSLYEGFGFPVLEALAAGALVVSSREGSLAEVAGPSWPLCELDADGLAEGITTALDDSVWQRRCLAQGPAWAARHDWATSIDRHVAVYEQVLA
jgi:glycosyltransferase involved in cell wall biosynthesis